MTRRPGLLLAVALLASAPLAAQQEAVVEQLAGVLAAEDARDFQPALFAKALVAPDSVVRRLAAMGAGRIGDQRATAQLLPILGDPDSTVRVAAAFAVGLLRDTSAIPALIDRLTGQPALDGPTALESITALARIGGPRAGEFLRNVLTGSAVLTAAERGPLVYQALFEAWRLGPHAPVDAILPFTDDTSSSGRWRAAYSLGRLRAPRAGERLTVSPRRPRRVRPSRRRSRRDEAAGRHGGARAAHRGRAAHPRRHRRQSPGQGERAPIPRRLSRLLAER